MNAVPQPSPDTLVWQTLGAGTRAGQLLRTAAGIVDGVRNVTHGDKERSFQAIAVVWNAHLDSRPLGRAVPITAADVVAMMVLMKFKRSEQGQHIEDHGVDAAGYAAIWGELREAASDDSRQLLMPEVLRQEVSV